MYRYRLGMVIDDVPALKILDGSFWTVLYSTLVWSSSRHTPELIYNQLLPYLNSLPFSTTLADNSDDSPSDLSSLPVSGDTTQMHALVEACSVMMVRRGVSTGNARLFQILLRFQLCVMMFADIHQGKIKGNFRKFLFCLY